MIPHHQFPDPAGRMRRGPIAGLRERAGASEVALELPDGAPVADALARVEDIAGGLPVVMAVNREYADETPLVLPATSWR